MLAKALSRTPCSLSKFANQPKISLGKTEKIYYKLKRLEAELRRVTEERDILKKAAAYFAKESK